MPMEWKHPTGERLCCRIIVLLALFVLFTIRPCQAISCDSLKNIVVSENGSDDSACLTGKSDCLTLQYVLQQSTLNCTKINVTYNNHLNISTHVSNVLGLTIIGNGKERDVNITCSNHTSTGIVFTRSNSIKLEKLIWYGCSQNSDQGLPKSAITFQNCMDITVQRCQFTNSHKATGLVMFDVGRSVQITDTNFIRSGKHEDDINDNGGAGLHVELSFCGSGENKCNGVPVYTKYKTNASYLIKNCSFVSNVKTENEIHGDHNSPTGRGGGLVTYLGGGSVNNTITVESCTFVDNLSKEGVGGGMSAEIIGPNTTSNVIAVINCTFYQNAANFGGGLYSCIFNTHKNGELREMFNNTLLIKGSRFSTNQASSSPHQFGAGAGMFYYTNNVNSNLTCQDSIWSNNSAQWRGSAIQLTYDGTHSQTSKANFESCEFNGNNFTNLDEKMSLKQNDEPMGAMYAENMTLNFSGLTTFQANIGSALALNSSTIHIYNQANFSRNSGVHGGAIVLIGVNRYFIFATEDSTMNFTDNFAVFTGGAIDTHLVPEDTCVFDYDGPDSQYISSWKTHISFFNNIADTHNNSIYIDQPGSCPPSSQNYLLPFFTDSTIFSYSPDVNMQVTTAPKKLYLQGNETIRVRLGEPFTVHPVADDYYGNRTNALARVLLFSNVKHHGSYNLHGPAYAVMNEDTTYHISGPNDTLSQFRYQELLLIIYRSHSNALTYKTTIQLLEGCNLGYVYNTSQQMCVPAKPNDNLYYELSAACIRYGYWYGEIDNAHVVSPCPSKFCNYTSGNCPTTQDVNPCTKAGFCVLSVNQCNNGREGPLCADCKHNYCLTFDALQCALSSTYTAKNTLLVVFLMIIYWLVFVIVLLLVLRFASHSVSGYMYVVLYYFSVVNVSLNEIWPSQTLRTIVKVFVAFTQFSPQVLGEWKVCFIKHWNSLDYQVLNYTTSVVVSITILAIIAIGRYCKCPRALSLAQNSPIRVFCILILLSYTSLSENSFEILKVISFSDVKSFFVFNKPDVSYMSLQHLPYALIAICIEIIITIVSVLIVFASCLEGRLNYVKLRIKPIVDELQACYHTSYRWFAGYYLICRQLVYLTTWIPQPATMYVMLCLHISILVIHILFQPYQSRWLNKLDAFILLDLVLLTALSSPTSTFLSEMSDAEIPWKTIKYILLIVPCMYTIGVVGSLIMKPFLSYCLARFFSMRKNAKSDFDSDSYFRDNCDDDTSASKTRRQISSTHLNTGASERDPLLT